MVGSRRLILLGLASQIIGFAVLMAGLQVSTVVVSAGLVFVGVGAALCLTPITSLAMTAVPPERAGMASGIMSAQRALGSTVGFAVLGSILAAALTATLSVHLAGALPDPTERKEVAAMIIGNANPRAYSAEIGPGRPIQHLDAATQKAILAAADTDFVEGIRFSLSTARCYSPSSSPPASPGFPAARAPSRTPSVRRKRSSRRRPPAKALFSDGKNRVEPANILIERIELNGVGAAAGD